MGNLDKLIARVVEFKTEEETNMFSKNAILNGYNVKAILTDHGFFVIYGEDYEAVRRKANEVMDKIISEITGGNDRG